MMFEILDNLLPKYYLKDLQDYFISSNSEWYFNDNITNDDSFSKLGSFGFTLRLFSVGTGYINSFPGILTRALTFTVQEKIEKFSGEYHSLVRARGDMTLYNPENHRHELHTDMDDKNITAIFYVNTSDGNTLLYDREGKNLLKEIEPVENRLLIFDGNLLHTGHSPSKHKCRVLINMNFMNQKTIEECMKRGPQ